MPRYEQVLDICGLYSRALDLEELGYGVAKALLEVSACDEVSLMLRNGADDYFLRHACYPEHASVDSIGLGRVSSANNQRAHLVLEEQALLVLDFAQPEHEGDILHQFALAGFACAVALPLTYDSVTVGVSTLAYRSRAALEGLDWEYLRFIGRLIGSILHSRRADYDGSEFQAIADCRGITQDLRYYLQHMLDMAQRMGGAAAGDSPERAADRARATDQSGASARRVVLSERDRLTLKLLGEGMTDKEIAERIYVSEGAVKKRLSALYAELGLRNRVQAAVYASQAGLLD